MAAWVCPGRSALQSAEQWCQRRYGRKHRMMIYIMKKCKAKTCKKGQVTAKPFQTSSKTHLDNTGSQEDEGSGEITTESTTPEWEDASSTLLRKRESREMCKRLDVQKQEPKKQTQNQRTTPTQRTSSNLSETLSMDVS